MIVPGNEKLFKMWAEKNGYEQNSAKANYLAKLQYDESGHISNPEYVIDIITRLQQEIGKLEASNNTCIANSLQAAANTIMTQLGLMTEDNLVKSILGIPHENIRS